MNNDGWVTIARAMKARGNRGEIAAEPLSSHPERFRELTSVTARIPGGELRTFEVEAIWEHKDRLIFKFRGVDTISSAEALVPADILIPATDRKRLPAGEFYHSDLTGCEVVDQATGRTIGLVAGVEEYGGPPLLSVTVAGQAEPLLIPFVAAICADIDPVARRIRVSLPGGLEELNRDPAA